MSEPRQRIVIVRGRFADRMAEQADANRLVAPEPPPIVAPVPAAPPQHVPVTTGTTGIQTAAAQTITCPSCGNPVVLGSPFCAVCGTSPYQRPAAAQPDPPPPTEPATPTVSLPQPPELPDDADEGATVVGGTNVVHREVKILEYYVPLPDGELLQVMPNGEPVPMTFEDLRARQARKARAAAAQRQIESLESRAYWDQRLIDAAQQYAAAAPEAAPAAPHQAAPPPQQQGGFWGYEQNAPLDGWGVYVAPQIGAQEWGQGRPAALPAPADRRALPAASIAPPAPAAPAPDGWSLRTMRVPTWLAVVIFLLVIHTGLIYLPPTSARLVGAELPLFKLVARAWPFKLGPVPFEPRSVGEVAAIVPAREGDPDEFAYQRAPGISRDQFCTVLAQWQSPMVGECEAIYGDFVLLGIEPAMALDESAVAAPGAGKTGIGAPPPFGLNNLYGMMRAECNVSSGDPTPCAKAFKNYRDNAWEWSRAMRAMPAAFDLTQRLQIICNNQPPSEKICSIDDSLASRQKRIREIRATQPGAPLNGAPGN